MQKKGRGKLKKRRESWKKMKKCKKRKEECTVDYCCNP